MQGDAVHASCLTRKALSEKMEGRGGGEAQGVADPPKMWATSVNFKKSAPNKITHWAKFTQSGHPDREAEQRCFCGKI
jgi:hypothetical protein